MKKVEPSGVVMKGVCQSPDSPVHGQDRRGGYRRVGAARTDTDQCVPDVSRRKDPPWRMGGGRGKAPTARLSLAR